MKAKVNLNENQISTLKSMNKYWEEIAARPDKKHMLPIELNQMLGVIGAMNALLIVGEYANRKELFNRLFERIKHGDEEHQKWLKEEIEKFMADESV